MDAAELKNIATQFMDSPYILGRLVCNLRDNEVQQIHKDGQEFEVFWRDRGDHWRCTIFIQKESELIFAQIDLHQDSTIRIESHYPCSITVDPREDVLCLTRYTAPDPLPTVR